MRRAVWGKVCFGLAAFVLASGVPVAALEAPPGCDGGETPVDCYNRLRSGLPAAEDLRAVAKKADPAASTEAGTVTSFLAPWLLESFGFDTGEDTDNQLTFRKTFLSADSVSLGAGTAFRVALVGTILDGEVFSPLTTHLEGLDLPEELDLDGEIDDLDALDLRIEGNLESAKGSTKHRFGRDPRRYVDLYELLVDQATVANNAPGSLFALGVSLRELQQELGPGAPSVRSMTFDELRKKLPAHVDRIERLVVETAKEVGSAMDSLSEEWKSVRSRLDDLVANQPQLVVSFTNKEREGVTGPDERVFEVRYEMGLAGNVNDIPCRPITAACLAEYLEAHEKAADNGNRFTFSLEYKDTGRFSFPLPGDNPEFVVDSSEICSLTLGYGRYIPGFKFFEDGEDGTRLDFEVEGEATDDDSREDRLVARINFTQKLQDETEFVIGAVWANHPEFRGEVDEEFGAQFGLVWKGLPKFGQ